ncbi:MAG: VanZ family protein [Eubacteriales bacterium]|nr:VanZ family protein [Eubacteriales bacterium]
MAFYVCLILTILWFFFMTYLSHQDGEHTSRASRDLAEHLRFLDTDINDLNGKLRRAAHIVVFAVFTFLLGLTLDFGGASLKWMIIAAVWSYVDETTKPWIQGRHFSWFDVGLNLIGTAIGSSFLFPVLWIV